MRGKRNTIQDILLGIVIFEFSTETNDKHPECPDTGCWEHDCKSSSKGYKRIGFNRKCSRVHKLIFEHFRGPVGKGLVLDHLCRNRGCCNPDHLEEVTIKENSMRGKGFVAINSKATHCIRGHAFAGSNLYLRPNGNRGCIACQAIRNKVSGRKRIRRKGS